MTNHLHSISRLSQPHHFQTLSHLEIEGSLTNQLSTLIQKNGFLCQKIENLQRINTDLEYKFSITTSELERARREYTELQAKYELRNHNYKDLKEVCYQLDAQLNKRNGIAPEDSLMNRMELAAADRKKRRLSVDLTENDSDTGFSPYDETEPSGAMVTVPPTVRTIVPVGITSQNSPPDVGATQSTWTCLWKSCNQVFGALDWLVSHVEEFHIGLGKVPPLYFLYSTRMMCCPCNRCDLTFATPVLFPQ